MQQLRIYVKFILYTVTVCATVFLYIEQVHTVFNIVVLNLYKTHLYRCKCEKAIDIFESQDVEFYTGFENSLRLFAHNHNFKSSRKVNIAHWITLSVFSYENLVCKKIVCVSILLIIMFLFIENTLFQGRTCIYYKYYYQLQRFFSKTFRPKRIDDPLMYICCTLDIDVHMYVYN